MISTPQAPATQGRTNNAAIQQIAAWHLFGDPAEQPQVQAPPEEEIPETKLNLVLRGVMAVEDEGRAQAIIAKPGGDEQHYGVGDSLPGGAVLKEIKPASVILLRNGQFETLSLPKEQVEVQRSAAAPGRRGGAPSSRRPRSRPAPRRRPLHEPARGA